MLQMRAAGFTCLMALQRDPSDFKQVRQVRVGCCIFTRPLNGCICDVHAYKVPAVHGCPQQRVDQVGTTANVQHPHRSLGCKAGELE